MRNGGPVIAVNIALARPGLIAINRGILMKLFRLLAVLILVPGGANAGEAAPVLTMSGRGTVSVVPDQAQISVGVEVQAPTADRALRLNTARMKEMFSLLASNGIDRAEIQIKQFALHPQWREAKSSVSLPLVITGYAVSNIVSVRVGQLERLGLVLDSLTKAGANRIQAITFGVAEPAPHLDAARRLAVADARRKAALVAKAAGVSLGPILSIEEPGSGGAPTFREKAAFAPDSVPIAEGTFSLGAEITIRWAIE